ncbi:glycosyl transferase family protein [Acinetobacter qingfengensis]|nr:glycosyl transferase family protein [Acinetobacter qingfengensis]KAA8734748.1 glycosyl transferase family protein [Acinetobacter qingfengensis]
MNTIKPTTKRNFYALEEHPFAQYVRILGKGKTGSRSLTYDEAYQAFTMILKGDVLDVQIGAFLMLLRVKEESVDELAGFVQATKNQLNLPALPFQVDLDWSSYAGKRKHYPWFLLSALTLAQHGYKVVMHGVAGHTINRLYTEQALLHLDFQSCQDIQDIPQHLQQQNFAFIPLELLSPVLNELIQYRQILGLRSPVHTLSRLINPYDAKATLQAIFHPAYRQSHQQAAYRLGYQNSAVIKGEGGEFERNPDAKTLICGIKNGKCYEQELPKLNPDRSVGEEVFDLDFFKAVWLGQATHDYGNQAITETLAIALMTMQISQSYEAAQQLAYQLWLTRFNGNESA